MKPDSTISLVCLIVLTIYFSQMKNDAMAGDSSETSIDDIGKSELLSYGINSTAEVLAGLKHNKAPIRAACLRELSRSGDLKAVPAITELLNDSSRYVRFGAIRALHEIVSRQNRLCAEQIWLESQTTLDRFDAAQLFIDIGDLIHHDEVLAVLQTPTNPLFIRAVRSVPQFAKYQILGKDRAPIDWVKILTDLLNQKDMDTSKIIDIASALKQIGTDRAIAGIKEAYERQTDLKVKMVIQYLLKKK